MANNSSAQRIRRPRREGCTLRKIKPRWKTRFGRFVESYGLKRLAEELKIDLSAIYHWMGGRTSPDIVNVARIQKLASRQGVDLSLMDIYRLRDELHAKRGISVRARVAIPSDSNTAQGDPSPTQRRSSPGKTRPCH